jgi:hypothetical protein
VATALRVSQPVANSMRTIGGAFNAGLSWRSAKASAVTKTAEYLCWVSVQPASTASRSTMRESVSLIIVLS